MSKFYKCTEWEVRQPHDGKTHSVFCTRIEVVGLRQPAVELESGHMRLLFTVTVGTHGWVWLGLVKDTASHGNQIGTPPLFCYAELDPINMTSLRKYFCCRRHKGKRPCWWRMVLEPSHALSQSGAWTLWQVMLKCMCFCVICKHCVVDCAAVYLYVRKWPVRFRQFRYPNGVK